LEIDELWTPITTCRVSNISSSKKLEMREKAINICLLCVLIFGIHITESN
jgi:hypothetical protein